MNDLPDRTEEPDDIQEIRSLKIRADGTVNELAAANQVVVVHDKTMISGDQFEVRRDVYNIHEGGNVTNIAPKKPVSLEEAMREDQKFIYEVAEELKMHYLNTTCKKQLFPWERPVALEEFYVKLTIDQVIQKPNRSIKRSLPEYYEIFDVDYADRRFVLEGRPGLGKSTFCAKIAYDWSHRLDEEKSPFKHVQLLFLLRLGDIESTSAIEEAIFDQLLSSSFRSDDPQRTERLRKIIDKLGKAVVIVFDSLDETDPGLFQRQEIGSIVKTMQFQDLRSCRVLVTSRPWRVNDLDIQYAAYRRLELKPFTKSDILKFVKRFFGQNVEDYDSFLLGGKLEQYIIANKVVVDMSIPMITLLICWYWQKTGGNRIPERLGEVYDGVFDIMSHQLPDSDGLTKETIVSALGGLALQGLQPSQTKLVFSWLECRQYCSEEEISAARRMSLISRKGYQSELLSFFHKSGQEKVAGVHLAKNSTDIDPYLESIETVEEALNVGNVLISAAAENVNAADKVLTRLLDLFKTEIQPEIKMYYNVELQLDQMRRIQQYIELCLECNYEADVKTTFNNRFEQLFDDGQVYCLGLKPYPAVALGYYMRYSGQSIRSLRLQPVPNLSEPVVHYGPWRDMRNSALKEMKRLPRKMITKLDIRDEYRNSHSLHKEVESLSPAEFVSYIQCTQACEDLPPTSEASIIPIIKSFEYINLQKLSIDNFKLETNFDELVESIAKGNLRSLKEIWAPAVTSSGWQMTQLVEVVDKMPKIKALGIHRNEIEKGKTLPVLVKKLPSCTLLQSLHLDNYKATADDMKVVAENLPSFSSQLRTLFINNNEMDDDVATLLAVNLPRTLTYLGMSIWQLSRSKHSELLVALTNLTGLQKLGIYSSPYPSDLVMCAGSGLLTWKAMTQITLTSDESDESREETSQEISTDAWQMLETSLDSPESNVSRIRLSGIRLQGSHYKKLLKIGEQKKFRHLMYSGKCLSEANRDQSTKHEFVILE